MSNGHDSRVTRLPSTPRSRSTDDGKGQTKPTGTSLFHGYNIQLMNLSKSGEFIDNVKKFAKFCWDPSYREKIRNKFFEKAKSEILNKSENKDISLPEKQRTTEEINNKEIDNIAETIRTIIATSSIDMPENKKMELVLFTINNSSPQVQKAFKQLAPQDAYKDYETARKYFLDKKNDVISKITTPVAYKVRDKEVRPATRDSFSKIVTEEYSVSSEKELEDLKMKISKETIGILASAQETIDYMKAYLQKLIEDPEMNFSEKQSFELSIEVCIKYGDIERMKKLLVDIIKSNLLESDKIELMLMAVNNETFKNIEINIYNVEGKATSIQPIEYFKEKTRHAIDEMAIATAAPKDKADVREKLMEIKASFTKEDISTVEGFKEFQKAYAIAVISTMTQKYSNYENALTLLEHNVSELLSFDSSIILSMEVKNDLIAFSQFPRLIIEMFKQGTYAPTAKTIEKLFITEVEAASFLANPITKKITDLEKFKEELYKHYPTTNPQNARILRQLQDLRQEGNRDALLVEIYFRLKEKGIERIATRTGGNLTYDEAEEKMRAAGIKIIDEIINEEYHPVNDAEKTAFRKIVFTAFLNKQRDLMMNDLLLDKKAQEDFLDAHPQYKSITTQATFVKFKVAINGEPAEPAKKATGNKPVDTKPVTLASTIENINDNTDPIEISALFYYILQPQAENVAQISYKDKLEYIESLLKKAKGKKLDLLKPIRRFRDYTPEFQNKVRAMCMEQEKTIIKEKKLLGDIKTEVLNIQDKSLSGNESASLFHDILDADGAENEKLELIKTLFTKCALELFDFTWALTMMNSVPSQNFKDEVNKMYKKYEAKTAKMHMDILEGEIANINNVDIKDKIPPKILLTYILASPREYLPDEKKLQLVKDIINMSDATLKAELKRFDPSGSLSIFDENPLQAYSSEFKNTVKRILKEAGGL